jgi:hypothetical protein
MGKVKSKKLKVQSRTPIKDQIEFVRDLITDHKDQVYDASSHGRLEQAESIKEDIQKLHDIESSLRLLWKIRTSVRKGGDHE